MKVVGSNIIVRAPQSEDRKELFHSEDANYVGIVDLSGAKAFYSDVGLKVKISPGDKVYFGKHYQNINIGGSPFKVMDVDNVFAVDPKAPDTEG